MVSDHSGHAGHSMPMPDHSDHGAVKMCSMNMLWNSQVEDVCVVFSSWHITGPLTMVLSCIVIIVISIFYASLLHYTRNFDKRIAINLFTESRTSAGAASRRESHAAGLLPDAGRRQSLIPTSQSGYAAIETGAGRMGLTRLNIGLRVTRGALYALSVAISFWLMLVAMTYNTYLFLSIVIGAFIGHVMYEGDIDVGSMVNPSASKGLACH
ncbi:Ctr copper transporter family-domain-containing protein [Papiliotrema laurentii]|uniref:Copper transport protein n=1 Tax=Papiliotrema laurentii TaxID=5418 RepID=A0AAD9FU10_PAPLA|nr:Ctr copper transporter family-domain-containing protein [Papiliotrema laurentii]